MRTRTSIPHPAPGQAAFTLVEVLLALGIAIGLLMVALFFYSQSADLRAQILRESERISTIRLLTGRLTADLRSAQAHAGYGFIGNNTSMRFVKPDLVNGTAWHGNRTQSDLKLVTFSSTTGLEETNEVVTGFTRTEQTLNGQQTAQGMRDVGLDLAMTNTTETAFGLELEPESMTNSVAEPLTEVIRFVNFRYWDGSDWVNAWDETFPPLAVEASFGVDPLPEDATVETYPYELFRRVILLPGGRAPDLEDLLTPPAEDISVAAATTP